MPGGNGQPSKQRDTRKYPAYVEENDSEEKPKKRKTRTVASGKLVVWMGWITQGFTQLMHPPVITVQVLIVLRVDRVQLTLSTILCEEWTFEELAESVQHTFQMSWRYIKVVVGVRRRCECV